MRMKKLLLSLLSVVGLSFAAAAQEPLYSLEFNKDTNDKAVSNYTSQFNVTVNGLEFNLSAFNNNGNGAGTANSQGGNSVWTFVRCGRKNNASTATITTATAVTATLNKVVINAKKNKTNAKNQATSAQLLVADNDQFTDAAAYDIDVNSLTSSDADITIDITSPAADKYYQIKIVMPNNNNDNGWLQINNVKFYGTAGETTKQSADLSFGETTEFSVNLGEAFTAPKLTYKTDGEIAYESNNEAVAVVDENTGAVEIKGAGTAKITATSLATDTYYAGSASYTITVTDPNKLPIYSSAMGADFTFENPENLTIWSHDKTYGLKGTGYISGKTNAAEAYAVSPVLNLQQYKNANLTFKNAFNNYKLNGSNIPVSDFNGYAEIVVREAGTTEWTKLADPTAPTSFSWTFYDNEEISLAAYDGKQIQIGFKYISTTEVAGTWEVKAINITGAKADVVKEDAGLKFAQLAYRAVLGAEFTAPELVNPNNLPVSYTSSNPEVATVTNDGKVKILAEGKTAITAKFAGNDTYFEGLATYELTVITTHNDLESFYGIGQNNYGVVGFEFIVVYKNGSNCYVVTRDGKASLIFGTTSYAVGDVIPAGWEGQYAPYGGMPEIKPAGDMPAATEIAAVPEPAEVTALSEADVNKIVILKNVVFDAATPTTGNFSGTITPEAVTYAEGDAATTTIAFRNNFGLASVEAGTYDVKAAVASFNGTLQAYPIEFTESTTTGIEGIVVDENAPVEYFNLQGVRVSNPENGLYIRRQGNKATKVLVK